MRTKEDEQAALKALYDALLENETPYMESLRGDAQRAGEGLGTGIILKSKNAKGETSDFELRFPRYSVSFIAALTGFGKTTMMANVSTRMTAKGKTGFFVTLEEPAFSINAKMMAAYSRNKHINYSMDAATVYDALAAISGKKDHPDMEGFKTDIIRNIRVIDANKSVDLEKIETPTLMYQPQYIADLITYRNNKSDKPLDFVVIDFGQLMETMDADNSSSYLRLKAVMQAMKNLSGTLGIAVIMGVQMKREAAFMSVWDWVPELIRDGSDLEQAASLIIAIGRDKEYHDKEKDMVIRFLKNRYGPKRVAGMFGIDYQYCHIPSKGAEPTND